METFQSGLGKQAEKIVKTVVSLAELLKEHRSRYLDSHTFAGGGAMTETERNQVGRSCGDLLLNILRLGRRRGGRGCPAVSSVDISVQGECGGSGGRAGGQATLRGGL